MYEQQRKIAKLVTNSVCSIGNGAAIEGLFSIGARAATSNPILGIAFQVCAFVSAMLVSSKLSDDIKPEVDKTVDKIIDSFDPSIQSSEVHYTIVG